MHSSMIILKFNKDNIAMTFPNANIGLNFISVLTGWQLITSINTYIIYTLFSWPRYVAPIMINTKSSW